MWKLKASHKAGRQRRYCSQIQYCLLVLLVPMVIFLLGAGALTTQAHTHLPQFQKQQSSSLAKQDAFGLRETFKIGDLQYKVNGVRTLDVVSNNNLLSQNGTFVLVNLTIENQGKSDIEIRSAIGFKLTDQNGKKQDSSLEAILAAKDPIGGTIKAGGKMTGELGYEINKGTQTFDLLVIPDPLSAKSKNAKVRITM